MGHDEVGTMALVRVDFNRMRLICASHNGEIINTMGDGMSMCFASVMQAVSFALEMQSEFGARKQAHPEQQPLEHRIGIHLGDVFRTKDADIGLQGDDVNIAARLEAKAPPGGICMSQMVYDVVNGKIPMQARFIGRHKFKNIAGPVPIWRVMPESGRGAAGAKTSSRASGLRRRQLWRWIAGAVTACLMLVIAGGWYWTGRDTSPGQLASSAEVTAFDIKSIAILPFTNMSDDKDTGYFADGMHEDLLTQLASLGELKVVSRTSVMDYRNTPKKVRQIGAELHVRYLVEGSVRRTGNQVRISAQLIDARTDQHLWAQSYDRELKDIFAIQSEISTAIAKQLKVSLTPHEEVRLAQRPTGNIGAYDLFLRHQELVNRSEGGMLELSTGQERIALLAKAVELDPGFALAWSRLGAEYAQLYDSGVDHSQARRLEAKRAMARAIALAPQDPQVQIDEAYYYAWAMNDYSRAEQAYKEVLAIAPNNVAALNGLATVYAEQWRSKEAISLYERALSVDARNPATLNRLADIYTMYRHFDRSLALRRQLIEIRPGDLDLRAKYYLNEYWRTGSWNAYDSWRATLPKAAADGQTFTISTTDRTRAIARHDFAEALRLTDASAQAKDIGNWATPAEIGEMKGTFHALILQARGDRSLAADTARETLRLIREDLKKTPADWSIWQKKASLHAILGERQLAFAALAKAVAVENPAGDLYTDELRKESRDLHALLGDRKDAIEEIAKQLKLPGTRIHELRTNIALASIWDDPQFQAIATDPATNAPLPFDLTGKYAREK